MSSLVSEADLRRGSEQAYTQLVGRARQTGALNADAQITQRVRGIAQRKAWRPLCQSLQESFLTMRLQKLWKRHWLHKSEGNPAHRHAVFKIPKREFQQRPGRDHWQLRHLLGKPPQLCQHLRHCLDFIQK